MNGRFTVTYHVHSSATDIEARAQGIAVEQSVEMPLAAIRDEGVLSDVVGSVEGIDEIMEQLVRAEQGQVRRSGRQSRRQ